MPSLIKKHNWSLFARLKLAIKFIINIDSGIVITAYAIAGFIYFYAFAFLRRLRPPLEGYCVICMPRGGLNDVLCQIKRCFYYSTLHRRLLIVCSDGSSVGPIQTLFSFKKLSGIEFISPKELADRFRGIEAFPCININDCLECDSDFGYSEKLNAFFTFDFRVNYSQNVLVHCGRGGGFGFDLIAHLRVNPLVTEWLKDELQCLPPCFDAVQVRDTDIKTNYEKILESKSLFVDKVPLLVCSDNDGVIQLFQRRLRGVRDVFSLRPLRRNSGLDVLPPLHYDNSLSLEYKNYYALLDLFSLAFCRRLYIASAGSQGLSGFPRLSKALHLFPIFAKIMLSA